ncbi:STAS domain-containing protein [Streptomyces cyaneofuscatus]|uniref:STAS domain-containing protein n=1 Tax=Streptomyces sp. 021-4 TaxID=2789260 RepID=UPI0039F5DAE8
MLTESGGSIEIVAHEHALVVVLSGSFDFSDRNELDPVWEEAARRQTRAVVVDLAAVDFGDSTLLNWLIAGLRLQQRLERVFVLAGPFHEAVDRLFTVTGLDRAITRTPTRQDALNLSKPTL